MVHFGRKSTWGENQVFAVELVYAGESPAELELWLVTGLEQGDEAEDAEMT